MIADRTLGVAVILASTLAESVGQLSFKRSTDHRAADETAGSGAIATAFAHWPWLMLGFAGFAVDGLLWSAALKLLPITVAHPIGSLVFVVTALLSRVVLRERIPPRRWLGVSLILAGSVFVALG